MMRVSILTARIEHICHGCLEKIKAGRMYERTETADGKPRLKLCMQCRRPNKKLTEAV